MFLIIIIIKVLNIIKDRRFAYYKLKHSVSQLNNLIDCFDKLKLSIRNTRYPKIEFGKRNNTISIGIYFLTRQFSCLDDLHNR